MRKIDQYRARVEPNARLKVLKFDIELDIETWNMVKPVKVICSDGRTYEKLNPPWTDVIVDKILEVHDLPCAFNFKNSQVSRSPDHPFLLFYGSCKECPATVYGECKTEPASNTGAKISIETYDATAIPHFKQRRLAKGRRIEAKQKLTGVKATYYRQVKASTLLNESGKAHPLLNNTAVYRVARQEARDEEIGLSEFPGDPITSALSMMNKIPSIREISTVPLVVWYWTDNQLELWKEAAALGTYVSIDASGRFVKAVDVFNGHSSSHIFLYNIVIRLRNKIYTIGQGLQDIHDANAMFLFLVAWIESGAPIPKEVVVDCSSALLNGLSLAFNKCYFQDYLCKCHKFLKNNNEILPRCLIKRDRAHLIKACLRWKCFAGTNWVKSDFYARCIAYSLEIEDLNQLEQVMTAMFIVCQSNTADKDSECFKKKLWLTTKIETFDYGRYTSNDVNTEELNHKNDDDHGYIGKFKNAIEISKYIDQIYNKSLPLCSNHNDVASPNNYHLPKIVDNLIQLFTQVPAWTNVMRLHYSSTNVVSTSTGSECYYRIMRHEYGMSAPISLNRFLLLHLRVIDGATKLGRAAIRQMKSAPQENNVCSKTECRDDLPGAVKFTGINSNNKSNEPEKKEVFLSQSVTETVTRYMRSYTPCITVAQYVPREQKMFLIKHHVLWSSEFKTLQPMQWIDGSVIDSFMIVNSNKDWKKIYFFPTGQTAYIIGNQATHKKPQSWPMYNIDCHFEGLVFLPYCFLSHWCLLVLDLEEKTITHYDPRLRYSGDRAVKYFLQYLRECSPAGKNNLCTTNWNVVPATTSRPMQADSYNCGIFVMYYMDCLSKGGFMDKADFDPEIYRSNVAHQLIASSESMNNICLFCLNDKGGVCSTCKNCQRWAHTNCILRSADKENLDRIIEDGICLPCAKH